jgi:hypothetical protein
MIIIGCDYHPGFQQIALVDTETGDYGEHRLEHSEGAEKFIVTSLPRTRRCEWEWKPVGMHAGLNVCWRS